MELVYIPYEDVEEERTNIETNVESTPPEIMRQIILSNYLNYKEMGKLLLLVSKLITAQVFTSDDVWKILLISRFGVDIAYEVMESFNCGPKKCFYHLIKKEPVRVARLRYSPSDYRIIINVYDDFGKRVIFKMLRGEESSGFFRDGYTVLKGAKGLQSPVYTKYSGLFRMKATVHIVRVSGQKSLCILDERKGLNEYSIERKHFIFTTSANPSSSLTLVDGDGTDGIYFNLRMKIRNISSRDICNHGYNMALYGNITLEALHHPTCALYKEARRLGEAPMFSSILENLHGWS